MPKVANQTCRVAGFRDVVTKGAVHADDDPVVKAHPWLFDEPDEAADRQKPRSDTQALGEASMSARKRPVENTRAEPGEKRSTRRRKKSS